MTKKSTFIIFLCIILPFSVVYSQSSVKVEKEMKHSVFRCVFYNAQNDNTVSATCFKLQGSDQFYAPLASCYEDKSQNGIVMDKAKIHLTGPDNFIEAIVASYDADAGIVMLKPVFASSKQQKKFNKKYFDRGFIVNNSIHRLRVSKYSIWTFSEGPKSYVGSKISIGKKGKLDSLSTKDFLTSYNDSLNPGLYNTLSRTKANNKFYDLGHIKLASDAAGSPLVATNSKHEGAFIVGVFLGTIDDNRGFKKMLFIPFDEITCNNPGVRGGTSTLNHPDLKNHVLFYDQFKRSLDLMFLALINQAGNNNIGHSGTSKTSKKNTNKYKQLYSEFSTGRREHTTIYSYLESNNDFEYVHNQLENGGGKKRRLLAYSYLLRSLYKDEFCADLKKEEQLSLEILRNETKERSRTYNSNKFEKIGLELGEINALVDFFTIFERMRSFCDTSEIIIQQGNLNQVRDSILTLKASSNVYRDYLNTLYTRFPNNLVLKNQVDRILEAFNSALVLESQLNKSIEDHCIELQTELDSIFIESPCKKWEYVYSMKGLYEGLECALCDSLITNLENLVVDDKDCVVVLKPSLKKSLKDVLTQDINDKFSKLDIYGATQFTVNSNQDESEIEIKFEVSATNEYMKLFSKLSKYPLAIYRNPYTLSYDSCLVDFLTSTFSNDSIDIKKAEITFKGSADGVAYKGPMKYKFEHYQKELRDIIPKKFFFAKPDGILNILGNKPYGLMDNNEKLSYLRAYEHYYNASGFISGEPRIEPTFECSTYREKNPEYRKSEIVVKLFLNPDAEYKADPIHNNLNNQNLPPGGSLPPQKVIVPTTPPTQTVISQNLPMGGQTVVPKPKPNTGTLPTAKAQNSSQNQGEEPAQFNQEIVEFLDEINCQILFNQLSKSECGCK